MLSKICLLHSSTLEKLHTADITCKDYENNFNTGASCIVENVLLSVSLFFLSLLKYVYVALNNIPVFIYI